MLVLNFPQAQLNFPELIILISHKINSKKTNTAKNICLFKATGEIVQGKNQRGNKKTSKYKPYLIILSKIFSIQLI